MLLTVLDTETTGLNVNTDDVLELAYITFRADIPARIVDNGILYFYSEQFNNDSSSSKIHQLTPEFMSKYKDQKSKNLWKMFKLISRGNIIGHNINKFDIPMICNMLEREGYELYGLNRIIDTYSIYRPYTSKKNAINPLTGEALSKPENNKLMTLFEYIGYTDKTIKSLQSILFPDVERTGAHTAMYDTIAAYYLYIYARKVGYI